MDYSIDQFILLVTLDFIFLSYGVKTSKIGQYL